MCMVYIILLGFYNFVELYGFVMGGLDRVLLVVGYRFCFWVRMSVFGCMLKVWRFVNCLVFSRWLGCRYY